MLDHINTLTAYDEIVSRAKELMQKKNADYGDSWKYMRSTTITDLIAAKIRRIIALENGQAAQVSESIIDNYVDIINYAVFALIHIQEQYAQATTTATQTGTINVTSVGIPTGTFIYSNSGESAAKSPESTPPPKTPGSPFPKPGN